MVVNGSYVQLSSLQMSEMSMDSGRGTIATVNSTRSSTSSRGHPMPAFPIAKVQTQISEDEEQSGHSGGQGHPWSQGGQRQPPPSPPVRERDRSVHVLRVLSHFLCEASLGIIVQGCRNCKTITMMIVQFEHST